MIPADFGEWREGAFRLNAPPRWFRDSSLARLSELNKGNRIERTAEGVIEIRLPVGGGTGIANAQLTGCLYQWNEQVGLGVACGSQAGFRLRQSGRLPPAKLRRAFA